MRARIWTVASLLVTVTAAGCSGGGTKAPKSTPSASTLVSATETAKGKVLTVAGRTLYVYDPDVAGKSNCTGTCLSSWPAVSGRLTPTGSGIDAKNFSVLASGQATYSGHPLYTFTGDKAEGDLTGDGYGGVWHAAVLNIVPLGSGSPSPSTGGGYGY